MLAFYKPPTPSSEESVLLSRKNFALFLVCLSCVVVLAARGANGAPEKPRKNEGVES